MSKIFGANTAKVKAEKRKEKFRKFAATDMCVASGSVSRICQIFREHQQHPLAPHLIYLVFGKIHMEPRFAGARETNFNLRDLTGVILCSYSALDIDIPSDVRNGAIVRCVGRLVAKDDTDQPTMLVIKVRVAHPKELEEHSELL